jgi:transcriptional regulator with XRE-family HTH domain
MAFGRRPNPVFSPGYAEVRAVLTAARREADAPQRRLAAQLGKAASHVSLIERGQRRVDVLEFYRIARALGADPVALFADLARRLDRTDGEDPNVQPVGSASVGTPARGAKRATRS